MNNDNIAGMANIPPVPWPAGMLDIRRELRESYYRPPRYEGSCGGEYNAVFTFIFPSDGRFAVRPQQVLRRPVGAALSFGPTGTSTPPAEAEVYSSDTDNDSIDDVDNDELETLGAEGEPIVGNTSNISNGPYSYPVESRNAKGVSGKLTPDFIIDQRDGAGGRRFMALVEIKRTRDISYEDKVRFIRYAERPREIHHAGVDLSNVLMVLIAGGRLFTWELDDWPTTSNAINLNERPYIRTHERVFLTLLTNMRQRFENLPWTQTAITTAPAGTVTADWLYPQSDSEGEEEMEVDI